MNLEKGKTILAWSTDETIRKRASSGGAVTAILQEALHNGIVDYVIGVRKKGDLDNEIVATQDPEEVKTFAGALHMAPVNLYLKVKEYAEKGKVICAVKPCETRVINLNAHRNQLKRENVILLGLNCGGTINPAVAPDMLNEFYGIKPEDIEKEEILNGKLIIETKSGEEKAVKIDKLEEAGVYGRRSNCRVCVVKIPEGTDLACGNWGVPKSLIGEATFVEIQSDMGLKVLQLALERGALEGKETTEKQEIRRQKVEKSMVNLAHSWRKTFYGPYDNMSQSEKLESFLEAIKDCDACGKCRDACPVCLCEPEGAKCRAYGNLDAENPDERDKILFHLTRIYHMMDLCTLCGQCDLVCEKNIDVSGLIARFALKRQDKEKWLPGITKGELPLLRTK
ncbi:MAG: Coenzyme F420 hydrogenase/dehydrogenase, beta subunit C-terminal domain [Candidatus Hodarchaeota archaeon]